MSEVKSEKKISKELRSVLEISRVQKEVPSLKLWDHAYEY